VSTRGRSLDRVIANIGVAEIVLTFVVSAIAIAGFVGLIALGTRLGTRGLRQRD
jgi:hypothetical protein